MGELNALHIKLLSELEAAGRPLTSSSVDQRAAQELERLGLVKGNAINLQTSQYELLDAGRQALRRHQGN